MENFVFKNRTEIIFGKDTHKDVGKTVRRFSKKVLFHYGGGSIKRTGLYKTIVDSLKDNEVEFIEIGGVNPNPGLKLIKEATEICRKNDIDFILAVGGGSVIDSAKGIAISVPYEGDSMWDFIATDKKPQSSLGIGIVLTKIVVFCLWL